MFMTLALRTLVMCKLAGHSGNFHHGEVYEVPLSAIEGG
jgi:hypothetical protein